MFPPTPDFTTFNALVVSLLSFKEHIDSIFQGQLLKISPHKKYVFWYDPLFSEHMSNLSPQQKHDDIEYILQAKVSYDQGLFI